MHGDTSLGLLDKHDQSHNDQTHSQHDQEDFETIGLRDSPQCRGEGGRNRDENQKRHSVTNAAFGDHFTKPHDEPGTRGHRDDHEHDGVPGVVGEQLVTRGHTGGTKQRTTPGHGNQRGRLKECETNGHVSGVLGQFRLTSLAFFVE